MFPHVCVANGIMIKCFGKIHFGNEFKANAAAAVVMVAVDKFIEYEILISVHDLF